MPCPSALTKPLFRRFCPRQNWNCQGQKFCPGWKGQFFPMKMLSKSPNSFPFLLFNGLAIFTWIFIPTTVWFQCTGYEVWRELFIVSTFSAAHTCQQGFSGLGGLGGLNATARWYFSRISKQFWDLWACKKTHKRIISRKIPDLMNFYCIWFFWVCKYLLL